MKRINIMMLVGVALASLLFTGACTNLLEEQPRADLTPDFLDTPKGIENGVTALYAHTRYIYGGYFYAFNQCGTDEATFGQSADNNFKDADLTDGGGGNLTPSSDRSDVLWNNTFPYINTANGIIEKGPGLGISDALLAEARFFRAWDYFMLVQTFGGVPLDLGAGEKFKYNMTPARASVRNTVPEVYTECIFPDLIRAIADLPVNPRVTGGITKNVARFYLAKAYLTYAWWMGSSIPTYPTVTDRTDPDGKTADQYFQLAYDTAVQAISEPGPYGLMPTFYDAHLAANDRTNREMMFYADHMQDNTFGGINLEYADVTAPFNTAVWLATWNYTEIRSGGVSSVQRAATQELGRPWTRMGPTIEVLTNTFADKTNDSRFDGTFVTTYFGNWEKGGVANATVTNANDMPVAQGGAILKFIDDPGNITYPADAGTNNVGAGTIPGEAAWVVAFQHISRFKYPGLWKLGPARTDSGNGLGTPNGSSPRPYVIGKFSELFLIAAEAAVQGATTAAVTGTYANDGTALGLINVLRARAGKWTFNNSKNQIEVADHSAAMTAATPATIDIDYILAERSRELYGEGHRWYDLVRTQKWAEKAATYSISNTGRGDNTPATYNRIIENKHYLRPIPQGQLDRMEEASRAGYQNPGWE